MRSVARSAFEVFVTRCIFVTKAFSGTSGVSRTSLAVFNEMIRALASETPLRGLYALAYSEKSHPSLISLDIASFTDSLFLKASLIVLLPPKRKGFSTRSGLCLASSLGSTYRKSSYYAIRSFFPEFAFDAAATW